MKQIIKKKKNSYGICINIKSWSALFIKLKATASMGLESNIEWLAKNYVRPLLNRKKKSKDEIPFSSQC